MAPEEIKQLRKELGCTARELATTLGLEQKDVLAWEAGDLFPTKRHVDQMLALKQRGPSAIIKAPRGKAAVAPQDRLSDPAFWAVVQKLALHSPFFEQVAKLAEQYPDKKT